MNREKKIQMKQKIPKRMNHGPQTVCFLSNEHQNFTFLLTFFRFRAVYFTLLFSFHNYHAYFCQKLQLIGILPIFRINYKLHSVHITFRFFSFILSKFMESYWRHDEIFNFNFCASFNGVQKKTRQIRSSFRKSYQLFTN